MFPKDVTDLLQSLSLIPYENLSKAIKFHSLGNAAPSLENSDELLAGHQALGTGGTCFSLTWFVCRQLTALSYLVYPVMCNHPFRPDTHCCAVLQWNGKKYLLDPGYLAFLPLELCPDRSVSTDTVFNRLHLVPVEENRYAVYTEYLGERKLRFTVKDDAISEADFFHHWQRSFSKGNLAYPVVTMVKEKAHLYLQKTTLYVRRKEGSHKIAVPKGEFSETLKKYFGIDASVSKKALEVFY